MPLVVDLVRTGLRCEGTEALLLLSCAQFLCIRCATTLGHVFALAFTSEHVPAPFTSWRTPLSGRVRPRDRDAFAFGSEHRGADSELHEVRCGRTESSAL